MPAVSVLDDESVTPAVRKAAAWAWRLLVLLAAVLAGLWVISRLKVIVVPVLIATMLTALLLPAVDALERRRVPRGAAVALMLLGGLATLGGLLAFVVGQFVKGLPDLVEQVTRSIDSAQRWLMEGPLHLSIEQIDTAGNSAVEALRNNQARLTSGALSTAATVTEIVTGALLVMFALLFFLHG
ncbi:MAG TPA: AI-2E family transporter, partial [Mycobacterium sp.]|nr:AI-2E family transporter [Mycobacterium sp.]